VKLRVEACAICGTDVKIFFHGHKLITPPHILGHEIIGTVVEMGPEVTSVQEGDRCAVVTAVGCGSCPFCIQGYHNLCVDFKAVGYNYPGGFAETIILPSVAVRQGNLLKLPPDTDPVEASLIEPLSCVINGQEYLNVGIGETAVVVGAGPIGCMHGMLARVKGAGRVILSDVSPERLKIAEKFGFDEVIDASSVDTVERVMELTGGFGAEVVIVACSVNKAQEDALRMTAKKGRISFFGGLPKDRPIVQFDSNLLHYREISVYGAFASHAIQYYQAMRLIASGKFNARDFITHRFKLDDIVEGIKTAKSAVGLKAVVTP
jgi:L-iditol 2-dehydrogenase